MGIIRHVNLGIRIDQETKLTVVLPVAEADALVRISRDGGAIYTKLPSGDNTTFQITITRGDYVLAVDIAASPSDAHPISINTDQLVAFWTAVFPNQQSQQRESRGGAGKAITQGDNKDPWPQPLGLGPANNPYLDSFLTSNSPIAAAMVNLIATSSGKGATPAQRIHALLIGIDQYNEGVGNDGTIYRNLGGAVYDALEIEQLVRQQLPDVRVTRLIAPRPGGPGSDLPPARLPTYANIVTAWKRITNEASAGDIVYIHYSGHGGRARTLFPDIKGPMGFDEAIAPCDINDREHGQYLRDVEITALLRDMAARQLITTLVLDSCYAGGAARDARDAQARQGKPDQQARPADARDSLVAPKQDLHDFAARIAQASLRSDWQMIPALAQFASSHTVIAACRSNEVAYEYAPEGEQRCGALTYFWRKALATRTSLTTYRNAYDQVYGNVHNEFTNQSPVILGEQDRMIFGASILSRTPAVPVVKVADGNITLRGGASTLLEVGTHLAIVPPDRLPELVDLAQMPDVEVVQVVDGQTSIARSKTPGPPIAVGAQGVIRSYPLCMQRSVRLRVPRNGDAKPLELLATAINEDTSRLLSVSPPGSTGGASFVVDICKNDDAQATYQLCDASGDPLPHAPAILVTSAHAAATVMQQLVHLTRYANALALDNNDPAAGLRDQLVVELLALPGYNPSKPGQLHPVPLPDPPEVIHGQYFVLRIFNRSQQPLQITILDLQPNWAIESIVPQDPVLAPGVTRNIPLLAELPDGYDRGREVLKVLGTSSEVDPTLLALPELGKLYPPRSPRNNGTPLDTLFYLLQNPDIANKKVSLPRVPSSGWMVVHKEMEIRRPASAVPTRNPSYGAATQSETSTAP